MKLRSVAIALLTLMAMPSVRSEEAAIMKGTKPMLTYEDVRQVAPQLAAYTEGRLLGGRMEAPPASRRATAAS